MEEDFEIQTVSSAMETMSDKDLSFIAAYNPKAMHSLCTMWALELKRKNMIIILSVKPLLIIDHYNVNNI